MVRIRLTMLIALANDWSALEPFLADYQQCLLLAELHQNLGPKPVAAVPQPPSLRSLRGALHELCESLERFNLRWRSFLSKICLDGVNEERSAYNRYFLLEK